MNTQSDSLQQLATALAKAQAEMHTADKSASNPFFKSKYADFATIVKASRPALTKHGLSVTQLLTQAADGAALLRTMLLHASGEFIAGEVKVAPSKQDVQSLGSYITYLKRYAYVAMVGVICEDEDDDGESSMMRSNKAREMDMRLNDPDIAEKISTDQYNMLADELREHPKLLQRLLESKGIESLRDITRSTFRDTLEQVRKVKAIELSAKK